MWSIYLNVVIQGVLTGLVYGLMALGLSVIFGVMRIVNFAHGEFLMLSMYLAIGLSMLVGVDPYFGLFIAIPLSLIFGAAVYYIVIRPVIARPHVVQIFTTLGLSIVLQNAALFFWTANFRQLRLSYGDQMLMIAGAAITMPQLIAFAVAALFTTILFAWLRFTYLGEFDLIDDRSFASKAKRDQYAAYAEVNFLALDWLNIRGTFDFIKVSHDRNQTRR
jgi:branched-chain amino acid transport system permease protein